LSDVANSDTPAIDNGSVGVRTLHVLDSYGMKIVKQYVNTLKEIIIVMGRLHALSLIIKTPSKAHM